jgi:hypothetical protein
MKKKIYGRKVGSKDDMVLLIEGEGVSTGCVKVDQGKLDQFALANARRAVQAMRECSRVTRPATNSPRTPISCTRPLCTDAPENR